MLAHYSQPVIVKIVEEPVRETTVVDVLLTALGLTGVLILIAVLLGAILGALFILYRRIQAKRHPYRPEAGQEVPRII